MKYYVCVEAERILYIQGRYKRYKGAGGKRRLEVIGWEAMEAVPDMASAMGRLAARYGLEGKKINLVLGRDLDNRSLAIPKAGRAAMRRMAANELIAMGINVRDCAIAVDAQTRGRKGAVPVTVCYMDGSRLEACRAAIEKGRMVCGRVLVLPGCMALMARELWKENRILLIDAEEESTGFYALSGGHCLSCRMTPLKAGGFYRKDAEDLLYEELAEQAGEILKSRSASKEVFIPECIVLMAGCLPEAEDAAGFLEEKLGIPCQVRTPDVCDCGGSGEAVGVNVQCLAACVAGSMDGSRKALELTVQGYQDGQAGPVGLGSAISRGWAMFLLANVLAAACLSFHMVYLNHLAQRELVMVDSVVNSREYKERSRKARQMDRRIQELTASREAEQAVRAAVSGENVLGMEAFRAFTDAMIPGMKIEAVIYEGEDTSLQMVVSMDRQGDIPDYVERIRESGRFREINHSLWEKRTEGQETERYYATVSVLLGTGGQDEIQ